MSASPVTVENAPKTGFHYRIAAFTGGGIFIDGYILGVLVIALPVLPSAWNLTSFWEGAIASAALVGLFFGSLVFGPITDKIGRKTLYTLDLAAFVLLALTQFFATSEWQLAIVRFLVGVAVGADYAVGPAYLAEFLPTSMRGRLLGALSSIWRLGFLASVGVGVLLLNVGDDAWRWILVSAAVPAIIVTLLRLGMPESPRWLAEQGRVEEARHVVQTFIHPDCTVDDLVEESRRNSSPDHPLRQLFSPRWRKRTFFMGSFWFCQVAPGAAIAIFMPTIFMELGVGSGNLETFIENCFGLLGGLAGLLIINRIGRRPMLIGCFWIAAFSLVVLALVPTQSAVFIILIVAVFQWFDSIGGNLQYVYPSELFPTSLRASAAGTAAAISRIGSAFGTFLFPTLLAAMGITAVLLLCAGIFVLGALIATALAPETNGLTLAESTTEEQDIAKPRVGATPA